MSRTQNYSVLSLRIFFFIYIKLLLKSYLTLNAGDLGSKVKIKISN